MAITAARPAFDARNDGVVLPSPTTDQRGTGFARTPGAPVDIGAFEFVPPTAFLVTTLADVVANDGVLSLREAIQAAVTRSVVDGSPAGTAADDITFDPSLFAGGAGSIHLLTAGDAVAGASALGV